MLFLVFYNKIFNFFKTNILSTFMYKNINVCKGTFKKKKTKENTK